LGTEALLRLVAAAPGSTFHYISSMAVFPWGEHSQGAPLREEPTAVFEHLPTGYCESKWVAERLVLEASERGAPVTVYRPGFVTGASETGIGNDADLFYRLLKGCIQLGRFPALPYPQDLTPVDYAARAIVELSALPATREIFHIVNPEPMVWNDLASWVRDYGYPIEQSSYLVWVQNLRAACRQAGANVLSPLLSMFDGDEADLFSRSRWDCSKARAALRESSSHCPPAHQLLAPYFERMIASGFLPPPPSRRSVERDGQ
jgi:thioester reductase-like protein